MAYQKIITKGSQDKINPVLHQLKAIEFLKSSRNQKTKKASTKTKPSNRVGKNNPVPVRLALGQINAVVGDFKTNSRKIISAIKKARQGDADLIVFPELVVCGYPPEDLLLKENFLRANRDALESIVPNTQGITAIVGFTESDKTGIYNSAALIADGKLRGVYRKHLLPNYGVFDEKRYFREGRSLLRFVLNKAVFGITICEDIWESEGPGKSLCSEGQVDVLINISSSPFHIGKVRDRESMIRMRAKQYQCYLAYANLVGGQDELVFDGNSLIAAPDGSLIYHCQGFDEDVSLTDFWIGYPKSNGGKLEKPEGRATKTVKLGTRKESGKRADLFSADYTAESEIAEVQKALILGTRDYVLKNGFQKVLIGLSGGIDSALTAAIAVEALGPGNVIGVLMPSRYSSQGSIDDSLDLALNLGIETYTLPIEKAVKAYDTILKIPFKGTEPGIAEENLQARVRGNLLMALSNKNRWLVLTTGNKSEISVGYCTLYGDMAGGYAVIKDVPKTLVYELSRYYNNIKGSDVIPDNIMTKEPSAELRPDQKDSDSLPPYDVLDKILYHYVELDWDLTQLKTLGISKKTIERVIRLVDLNEYKRRQAPPGVKITPKAFGKDRRLPLTNGFR